MFKVKLREIEVYHGENIVTNDFYVNHFRERGKEVEHFLRDVIGRDKRYLIDKERENGLTMAIESSRKVLEKAGLVGSDIDMVVYASQLPEYVAPPSSIIVHNAINGKSECICYDINVNCAGMTVSLEQITKYMSVSPNIRRALVVGSDYINMQVNPDVEYTYGHYGDASCSIILEQTEEDCGLVSSKYSVNSAEIKNIVFPGVGFSKMFEVEDKTDLMIKWTPFECVWLQTGVDNIKSLLKEQGMTVEDISMFCLSQFVVKNIEFFRENIGIDEEKSIYVGDVYGYTGTSSPFIALYESIKQGKVKRGDYILFWTVGAGTENITLLFKY